MFFFVIGYSLAWMFFAGESLVSRLQAWDPGRGGPGPGAPSVTMTLQRNNDSNIAGVPVALRLWQALSLPVPPGMYRYVPEYPEYAGMPVHSASHCHYCQWHSLPQ